MMFFITIHNNTLIQLYIFLISVIMNLESRKKDAYIKARAYQNFKYFISFRIIEIQN